MQAFEASIQEANESPILERASLLAGQLEEMVLSRWQVDARRLQVVITPVHRVAIPADSIAEIKKWYDKIRKGERCRR